MKYLALTIIFKTLYSRNTLILFFVGSILLLNSCSKNSEVPVSKSEHYNQALHKLARLLIEDNALSRELLNWQLDQYKKTGLEEFLLLDLVTNITNQRTPSIVQQLLAQNPLMEIAYPSYAFYSNTETLEEHISSIQYYVVIEDGVDPESPLVDSLPAYDSVGNAVMILNLFDEGTKYAVIAMDESLDAFVGNSNVSVKGALRPNSLENFDPVMINGEVKYYEEGTIRYAEILDRGESYFGAAIDRGGDGGSGNCDRPSNRKDQLYKIRFSDRAAVNVIESGFRMPVVELIAYYGIASVSPTGGITGGVYYTQVIKNWATMNGCCWNGVDNISHPIKVWEPHEADEWGVLFIEQDGGSSIQLSFGVSPKYTVNKKWEISLPISFLVPAKDKDDKAGNVIIEYCDPAKGEGTSYKVYTGGNDGMYFRENLQSL